MLISNFAGSKPEPDSVEAKTDSLSEPQAEVLRHYTPASSGRIPEHLRKEGIHFTRSIDVSKNSPPNGEE